MRLRAFVWGTLPLSFSCAVYDTSLLEPVGSSGGSASGGALAGTDSGGGAGVGGTLGPGSGGGSGGTTCAWGEAAPTGETLSVVDDFDDNDKLILEVDGRWGRWNSDNDQSAGVQSPSGFDWESFPMAERADAPGNFALHYVGHGFTTWHLILAEFAGGEAYDLSSYDGIVLWVRGDCEPVTSSVVQLRISISDAESFESVGAIDHAGYAVPFALSPQWRQLKIPFSSLIRRFGSSSLFDLATARALVVSPNAPGDLDVWLDDIAFYVD